MLFSNDSIMAVKGKSDPVSFTLQAAHPKQDALREGQTEKMRGELIFSGLRMIQQILDGHQIGQAFYDLFRSVATFATTVVAIESQLLFPIEKLLLYKVKILLIHHFSELANS